jgi:hypothetical protein
MNSSKNSLGGKNKIKKRKQKLLKKLFKKVGLQNKSKAL